MPNVHKIFTFNANSAQKQQNGAPSCCCWKRRATPLDTWVGFLMNACLLLHVWRVWFLGQTRITLFYAPRHRVNFLCDLFYYDYQGLLIRHQGNFPRRVGHSLLPCTIRLASSLTMSKILFFCHADTYPAICTLQRTPDTSNNGATVVVHQIPKFNVSHGVWNDSEIRMLIAGR